MALTTEQFERIVGKGEPSPTAEQSQPVMLPDGTFTMERRRDSRFPFGQRAKIRLERADQQTDWNTVMLQDISLSGISFLCDQELPIDARLALCVKDQVGELMIIRCIVQRCEPGGFGRTSFTIGANFQQVVPPGSNEFPEAAGNGSAQDNPTDPFSATSSLADDTGEEAPGKMNQAILRAANILNPARWWSHLHRECDDFMATGTGSKLSKEMQTKITETMESYPAASILAPLPPAEEIIQMGQSSSLPRRSSIFLHADDAPPPTGAVESPAIPPQPPVAEKQAPIVVEQPTVAAPAPVAANSQPAIEPAPVDPGKVQKPSAGVDLDEFARWAKRDLGDKRYVYMWAGELNIDAASGDTRVMVLLGAAEKGQIELIAFQATPVANPATWKKLLLNVMRRGLIKPPKLAIGDRTLGFWFALADFARGTSKQYCWNQQIAHIMSLLPKGLQRLAHKELERISTLGKHEEAIQAIDLLVQDFQNDAPQAAACLAQEKEFMLAFYDFPAEHWPLLQNSTVIQAMFHANGPIKRDASLLMDETLAGLLKIAQTAQANSPNLPASQRLGEVLRGEPFIDGVKQAA